MTTLLADLYGHQAWADAQHWRAIGAHQPARDDPAIRVRLHHIHIVQRAFLWMVGDRKTDFAMTKPEDFGSFEPENLRAHLPRRDSAAYGRHVRPTTRRRHFGALGTQGCSSDSDGDGSASTVRDAQPVSSGPERNPPS